MLVLENGLTERQVEVLREAGFGIVPVVDSKKTLTKAEGLIQVDMDALLEEVGREKLRELIAGKKKSGKVVRSFNIVGLVRSSDFDSGAVFALSRVNLMRSMLS